MLRISTSRTVWVVKRLKIRIMCVESPIASKGSYICEKFRRLKIWIHDSFLQEPSTKFNTFTIIKILNEINQITKQYLGFWYLNIRRQTVGWLLRRGLAPVDRMLPLPWILLPIQFCIDVDVWNKRLIVIFDCWDSFLRKILHFSCCIIF